MSFVGTTVFILFIAFFTLLLGQIHYCNNGSQCVGTKWTLLSGQQRARIYGYGYKSLSGIDTSVTCEGEVTCKGAFACTQILFISSDLFIDCMGSHSCANVNGSSYIEAETSIECGGANAW
eukprot:550322_1